MKGKIIKGIAGFYYVSVVGSGTYECKAKGSFRNQKVKPLVGDDVEIAVISEEEKTGNVEKILPRSNELIRPAVANVDGALVVFAAAKPKPNLPLLDRFLVMMECQHIPAMICFNKEDLVGDEEIQRLQGIYGPAGYPVFFCSAKRQSGIRPIQEHIQGKTFTMAGPSGVGKSSLINLLSPIAQMETGEVSTKIERGRHTTRHSELIALPGETYLMDTPGFTALDLPIEKERLAQCYPEICAHSNGCRFAGCSHLHEPGCEVQKALAEGKISMERYESYRAFYMELQERKKY